MAQQNRQAIQESEAKYKTEGMIGSTKEIRERPWQ